MVHFILAWFIATLALVITSAQDVGWFVHYHPNPFPGPLEEDFHFYATVHEDKTVSGLSFNAYSRRGHGSRARTPNNYNPVLLAGRFPLTKIADHVYSVGMSAPVRRQWYRDIAESLYLAGHVDSKGGDPPAGIQPGDLVTFRYTSGDTITTTFRGETLELMRRAQYQSPGLYEYTEPVAPHLKLSFLVRSGENRYNGTVGIKVACDRGSTRRFLFGLALARAKKPYDFYDVKSAGKTTLDELRRRVRSICPSKRLKGVDFRNVVFASGVTIYVPFEGGRMALTRVE
ncbi:hypothetical protein FOZ63_004001 [Perkinsus olseni]|uniref:Uncharacterized protein n=1 Tax=Perkinsus olseni TaxID=32597 RepID=A0A7J6N5C4_PEROL|nr:hypothetical protein FOZ63_004001 [Perkinsus olseni]